MQFRFQRSRPGRKRVGYSWEKKKRGRPYCHPRPPLNLDDTVHVFADTRVQLISEIVAAHWGGGLRATPSHYDAWFRLPLFDALQELIINSPFVPGHHKLPASAYSTSPISSSRMLQIWNGYTATSCHLWPIAEHHRCPPICSRRWATLELTFPSFGSALQPLT